MRGSDQTIEILKAMRNIDVASDELLDVVEGRLLALRRQERILAKRDRRLASRLKILRRR